MAVSSAVGKHTANKILYNTKSLVATSEKNIRQAFGIHRDGIVPSTQCTRANMRSEWPNTALKKRKLSWMTVAERHCNDCSDVTLLKNALGYQTFCQPQKYRWFGTIYVRSVLHVSSFHYHEKNAFEHAAHSEANEGLRNLLSNACCWSRPTGLASPKSTLKYQSMRHLSRRRRRVSRSDDDDDDEEKKRRLRGAVMYISNPLTWVNKWWNMAKLKRKLDPSFSEDEFLDGAKQAVSHVSQMVSEGKFDQLSGLVIDEVIEWLMSFRNSLAATEREALALNVDDLVLMKIHNVHLGSDQGKALALVDSVCFGLTMCDHVPYFVDLGLRFKRDYSTDPPSDWTVAGVTHIRLQNLATDG